MKTTLSSILGFLLALAPTLALADIKVLESKEAELNIGAMTQVIGFGQQVDDPFTDHNRLYLFMKEARFRTNGRYQDYSFNLEFALGGEESIVAQTGVSLSLLDLSVNIPIGFNHSYLKVGQFKVPYGRERLTYSGYSQFLERSVQDLGFRVGRDVGLALTLTPVTGFTFTSAALLPGEATGPQKFKLSGTLSVAGVEKPITTVITVSSAPGNVFTATALVPLKMTGFGIGPPTAMLGIMKTADAISIRIALKVLAQFAVPAPHASK